MADELLVVKKDLEKMKFKVVDKNVNKWSPKKYERIIGSKDFNMIAYLFYDLYQMGYPIEKSYNRFKDMLNDPELFFM